MQKRIKEGEGGLTLDIPQRKVKAVGGIRWQCEVEMMATLRLVTVHDTYCLNQLQEESRG